MTTAMPAENYLSAAFRHHDDIAAGVLSPDNSAYLAGYVVECTLKAVLEHYGHAARAYGHDIVSLQGRALTLAAIISPGAMRYRVDTIQNLQAAAALWTPEMRYLSTGQFSAGDVRTVCDVAGALHDNVLVNMVLDGAYRSWP